MLVAPPTTQPMPGLGLTQAQESNFLGLSFLAHGVGAAIGTYRGGLFGGVIGMLVGGSALNFTRAYTALKNNTELDRREAGIISTYATIGLGVAGFLLYEQRARHLRRR